ncbi:MAG: GrpB family protein [Aeromicrobium erythreum]
MDGPLVGGPERRWIALAEPDPTWPDRFRVERDTVVAALRDRALRVDHIGSTSVPGLAAKPIVDLDLSVADPDDEDAYLPDLLAAGYVLRVREPGHRMVRRPTLDVHVHVCAAGSDWERRHLLFRDHLRAHPDDRALYEQVKRGLAGREWADTNDYADAKSEVIQAITARAEAWAAVTGWRP